MPPPRDLRSFLFFYVSDLSSLPQADEEEDGEEEDGEEEDGEEEAEEEEESKEDKEEKKEENLQQEVRTHNDVVIFKYISEKSFEKLIYYMIYQDQHSCLSTQSWGSVLPSIVEMRGQGFFSRKFGFGLNKWKKNMSIIFTHIKFPHI